MRATGSGRRGTESTKAQGLESASAPRPLAPALLPLAVAALLFLSGCVEQKPPQALPPPAAPAKPPAQEQVDNLVVEMERLSDRVEQEDLDDVATAQVLDEISSALQSYFDSPEVVQANPKVQGALERLCDESLQVELDANASPEAPNEEEASPRDELPLVTTFLSPEDLKATYEAVKRAEAQSNPDFPIETNDAVLTYVNLFSTKLKTWYTRALTRGQPYVPKMKEIFKDEGVPTSLVYLAIVESAFNPQAVSRAKAVGMWQFIPGTAKRYGLAVDFWEDQRKDPELAARAAARYLKDLHGMFGDWQLSLAAYNTGEGRIQRFVNKKPDGDFWDMRSGRALRRETREYVPAIIAAILLASNPAAYGIEIPQDPPPSSTATVVVDQPTDLRVLAKCADMSPDALREMNPSLRRIMTPPRKFELKIPARSLEGFQAKLSALPESERVAVSMHTVARGESLNSIARKYHVNAEAIRLANRLPNRRVTPGTSLVIPLGSAAADPSLYTEEGRPPRKGGTRIYKVRRGDTLSSIARKTGVPVDQLREINHLASSDLRPGQRLVLDAASVPIVPPKAPSRAGTVQAPKPRVHHIRSGDTLWDLARQYGTTVDQLCRANRITPSHKLQLGDTIVIP